MNKSTISVALLILLFLGSVETFAQKQIVRRVPNEPVVPQKQVQPAKTPTHHAPKKNREKKKGGYDYVGSFSEGLAIVVLNYKYGVINKSGTLVIPCKYDGVYSFREGLASVCLNEKWGFIDKSGTEAIPCKYDYAYSFCEGMAKVKLNGKYGFIDKSGTLVIPCKYDYAYSFSEGRAEVELNGKQGYVNKSGVETWD